MFNFLKRKKEPLISSREENQAEIRKTEPIDFSCPITDEEHEIVSVIASSILAGDRPDSTIKIKSVTGIDQDKEAAAAIIGAALSVERSNTVFRLKSITEITQKA